MTNTPPKRDILRITKYILSEEEGMEEKIADRQNIVVAENK